MPGGVIGLTNFERFCYRAIGPLKRHNCFISVLFLARTENPLTRILGEGVGFYYALMYRNYLLVNYVGGYVERSALISKVVSK